MTIKELIAQEQKKHAPKLIGDHIALSIYNKDCGELYFEDCGQVDSGPIKYADLIYAKVSSYDYLENYGDLDGKLKLNIEVE